MGDPSIGPPTISGGGPIFAGQEEVVGVGEDTVKAVERGLHKCLESCGAQKKWVETTLIKEMRTNLDELKEQAKECISDKTQRSKALEILGKLETNLEEIEKHPPENWESFMKDFFKDFEDEFKAIFKSTPKYNTVLRNL